ncbi:MAG: adenosylcobinamide-GDP ribazoletransferase [Candidatus Desulfofervidaceae bacterium]|nr:adenosylcobinamide-GDP ribazoletransferase [Candidatus Desulfofervidaceae bacterium]
MKDSHLGAFGAIGIFLLLLGKFLLYEQVIKKDLLFLLMAAPILSRWGMVFLAFISHPARPEGMGKIFAQNLSKKTFIYASIWTGLLIVFIAQSKGLLLWGLTTAFLWLFRHWSYKKIQGIIGDVLGASSELTEVMVFTAGLLVYH